MTATDSLDALRRANPRRDPTYEYMLDAVAADAFEGRDRTAPRPGRVPAPARRTSAVAVPIGAALLLAAAVVIALVMVGSPLGPPTVSPAAAVERAAELTATAADESGIVRVTITRDGSLWAAKTVHWHGGDVSISSGDPTGWRSRDLLVVDGMMYGRDPEAADRWVQLGSPDSVDPDSGTTPDEYLVAVREDAGGETLRRITAAMTDLTTSDGDDGSTIYQGHLPAGDLARETGTKEGQTIRVLPYGYVAHDDASDPSASIAVTITVGGNDTILAITATWGGASTWTYELTFQDLGSAAALVAPADARPFLACRIAPDRPDC
jgi:hypothetical protein